MRPAYVALMMERCTGPVTRLQGKGLEIFSLCYAPSHINSCKCVASLPNCKSFEWNYVHTVPSSLRKALHASWLSGVLCSRCCLFCLIFASGVPCDRTVEFLKTELAASCPPPQDSWSLIILRSTWKSLSPPLPPISPALPLLWALGGAALSCYPSTSFFLSTLLRCISHIISSLFKAYGAGSFTYIPWCCLVMCMEPFIIPQRNSRTISCYYCPGQL